MAESREPMLQASAAGHAVSCDRELEWSDVHGELRRPQLLLMPWKQREKNEQSIVELSLSSCCAPCSGRSRVLGLTQAGVFPTDVRRVVSRGNDHGLFPISVLVAAVFTSV